MAKEKVITKEYLESSAKELFSLMGVSAEIVVEEKEEGTFEINVESPEQTGLLIGNKGETLLAIQNILSQMVKQETGEWVRIVVNIGDWREKQENYLKDLAEQTALRVKETGEPQYLYNLTSAQRRIVHMELSNNKEIKTESQGEGSERCLVVALA